MALRSFRLTKKEEEIRTKLYKDIDYMMEVKNRKYPHFNGEDGDRTLEQYINDSDLRLNGNTPSRAAQDKEDWQSNLFNPVTRNKMKAMMAGVALTEPPLSYSATNPSGLQSAPRAEGIKQLVTHSRIQDNPELQTFFQAWEAAAKGTVVVYDGYLKTKYKRKFISSYDLTTGEIEFKEKEVIVDDRPIECIVPLQEFFIWDFNVFKVQDQPKIAWIKHYNREALEMEFGGYKNIAHVKDKETIKRYDSTIKTYFLDEWGNRVEDHDDYEVIRYYNKWEDRYEIWANGVPLLLAPLVWGRKRKMYPFSKTIFEPFVNSQFFWGKSFPSVIEGIQDVDNTLLNSILDKMYRSLTPPILVGTQNKDLFDIETELVNQDNKIYVPDVNAVKPMPFNGVTSGEIAMLNYVARLGDLASLDANQQGIQGKGVTAREILVANENAKKLKGIFFMFLTDLWIQKTRLRIINILMNYMQPKTERILGEKAEHIYNVPNQKLSDGTTGMVGMHVANREKDLLPISEIEAREDAMAENGVNYKLVSFVWDWLDDWDLDVNLTSETFANQSKAERDAMFMEDLQVFATFFPEYMAQNKHLIFKKWRELRNESVDEYQKPQSQEEKLQNVLGLTEPQNGEEITTGA